MDRPPSESREQAWSNVWGPDGYLHLLPNNDLVKHEWYDCVCGVRTERHTGRDGQDVWYLVHHALDGRP